MIKSQPTLVSTPFRFRSRTVEKLSYQQVRRLVKDASALRLALIRYALARGVKPAARAFQTSPQTVRAWLRRYREEGIAGLEEKTHRPKRLHPQTTPPEVEARVVALRERNPRLGQDRIAAELGKAGIALSGKTVGKILRRQGLFALRPKRQGPTPTLRHPKNLLPFAEVQVEVRDLLESACCSEQVTCGALPRYAFGLRDLSTGASFVSYGRKLDAHNVVCFVQRTVEHLAPYGVKPRVLHFAEGSAWARHKLDRDLAALLSQGLEPHRLQVPDGRSTLGVGAFLASLELFYRRESFESTRDLLQKVRGFELWYNFERRDTRRKASPLELAKRKQPEFEGDALRLAPICLDACVCP